MLKVTKRNSAAEHCDMMENIVPESDYSGSLLAERIPLANSLSGNEPMC